MSTADLTPHELTILKRIATGERQDQIAASRRVTMSAVNETTAQIRYKLGATTTANAVFIARERGLIGSAMTAQQRLDLVRSLLADPEVARALVAEGVNPREEEYSPTPPDTDEHYRVGNRWQEATP